MNNTRGRLPAQRDTQPSVELNTRPLFYSSPEVLEPVHLSDIVFWPLRVDPVKKVMIDAESER